MLSKHGLKELGFREHIPDYYWRWGGNGRPDLVYDRGVLYISWPSAEVPVFGYDKFTKKQVVNLIAALYG